MTDESVDINTVLDWIERDRREPDKILLHVSRGRRVLLDEQMGWSEGSYFKVRVSTGEWSERSFDTEQGAMKIARAYSGGSAVGIFNRTGKLVREIEVKGFAPSTKTRG